MSGFAAITGRQINLLKDFIREELRPINNKLQRIEEILPKLSEELKDEIKQNTDYLDELITTRIEDLANELKDK